MNHLVLDKWVRSEVAVEAALWGKERALDAVVWGMEQA